jgi:transposase
MKMALSLDIRERVINCYEQKEGSLRVLSKRFKIGKTTLVSWLKRKRTLGHLHPMIPSGRPSKFNKRGLEFLVKSLEKNNDLTLKTLAEKYASRYGIRVSLMTVHRACKRLNIRYKKNNLSLRTTQARNSMATKNL